MKRVSLANIFLAVLVVVFICSIFSVNATGKNKTFFSESSKEAEAEYLHEVKAVLAEYYMPNAGVMLTKVSQDGINIEYSLKIHTGAVNSEEMIRELNSLKPDVACATVNLIFE